jgi:hypothetical protein
LRVENAVSGRDGEDAAIGHGVAGIHAEVQQHLMDLCRVAHDRPEFVRENHPHLDVFKEGIVGDVFDLLDEVTELNHRASAFNAAGEGKNLSHHVRATLRTSPQDGEQLGAAGIWEAQGQHLQQHHDGTENVVQVVGNTAGERADAFHPLSAEILQFDFLLFGDVGVDVENGPWLPTGVAQQRPAAIEGQKGRIPCLLLDFPVPLARFPNGAVRLGEGGGIGDEQFLK